MSDLKPGDRAVAIRAMRHRPGGIVTILRGPQPATDPMVWRVGVDVVCEVQCQCCAASSWAKREWLIRLPPDDEAKRLFHETERPREVSA